MAPCNFNMGGWVDMTRGFYIIGPSRLTDGGFAMFELVTYEVIGEDVEEVSCGFYRTRKEAEYAALSTYNDVSPMVLTGSDTYTLIRE